MIPKEQIDAIRAKVNIINVISEYLPLRKRGRNHLGLCPFHSEKTPSFNVSEEKQLFHCFGCGEGGNVFDFLMKIENISFIETVVELAGKAGIAIEQPGGIGGPTRGDKEKLYDVLLLAARFFRQEYEGKNGQAARDYVAERGINAETARAFGLGLAPAAWEGLFQHLITRGASPQLIDQAGLSLPREDQSGYYDRFRNRLIFPILDLRGRVIAFSGRGLGDTEPKYLNSPDTPVYHKGETIFGLNLAKEAIKQQGFSILVEGNLDLLSVVQAGIPNVAAPLGTALTAAQGKLLGRFADTVVLAYDTDAAGEKATERSAELLLGSGFKIKVVILIGAKDPDEFIKQKGADAFRQAVESALPYLEFKIGRIVARHNLAEIEGRARGLREVAALLGQEKDSFVQQEYAKLAAGLLKMDTEALLAEVKRSGFYRSGKNDQRRVTGKPASRQAEAEKKLIALSAQYPEALATLKKELTPELFRSAEARAVATVLFNLDPAEGNDLTSLIVDNLSDEAAKRFLTQVVLSSDLENRTEILSDCINVIKDENARERITGLKAELREAENARDNRRVAELLSTLKTEIS